MHLAYLTPEYPHSRTFVSGGIGSSIKTLAHGLIKSGVRVSIFVYGQSENAVFIQDGIRFHLLKARAYSFGGWYLYRKHLALYLNRWIAREQIDVLEAADWTGITAFMRLRCPVVIRCNGSDTYFCRLEGRSQKQKNYWFEQRALFQADYHLAVSQFVKQHTIEAFKFSRSIQVIPNPVDADIFAPSTEPEVPGRLLYFGSLMRKKGVLELAHIFNRVILQHPKAHLILAGRDVKDVHLNQSTLKLFYDQLRPEVRQKMTYFPAMHAAGIRRELAAASVVVLPSFAEALPLSWLEAMSMGKAMVTSGIGWANEMLENEVSAFTEDPLQHDRYAAKIVSLLEDEELRREMGVRCRERVLTSFSTEEILKPYTAFYSKLV